MTIRYRPSPTARARRCACAACSDPSRCKRCVNRLPSRALRGRPALLAGLAGSLMLVAGCASVTPQPLSLDAIEARAARDRELLIADQEPLAPVLTLEQVAARAIKYNLDHRLRLLETALQQGSLDVSRLELLPRLTASAGYLVRSNDLYAQQQQLGQPYNPDGPYTTSSERRHRIAAAEFSWNLLDFGVSYYRARVQADQVMIADERRRKVVQNILQDVRSIYWRALGAQRLAGRVDDLVRRADAALATAREIEKTGLMPVPQALAYQRALLDSITMLQSRRHEMELARAELAALMNATGQPFQLSDLAEEPLPPPPVSVNDLEDLALVSRPELREEDYRKRISANEARRAIASAWPGVSLDLGWQYDSNRYLLHNAWAEGGLRVSLNLFRLAAIPALQRQAEIQSKLDDHRRLAQSMAVLTQVRVAALGYGLARNEYSTYTQSAEVDERLSNYSRASASSRVESDLEVIRTEARAMLSEYQRYIAYANGQAAVGRLYNSLGFDIDAEDESVPVRTLATQIRQSVRRWEWITFGQSVAAAQAPLPVVALRLEGELTAAERAAIARVFADVYRRHDLQLTLEEAVVPGQALWTLVARQPLRQAAPVSLARSADAAPAARPPVGAGDTLRPMVASGAVDVIGPAVTRSDAPSAVEGAASVAVVAAASATAVADHDSGPGYRDWARNWGLTVVRPNGSIADQRGYQTLPFDQEAAFRRDGDIRGAAEASAVVVRDFVVGSPFRPAQ